MSLAEATALYLERRYFAIPRLVTEVAYNLVYSLAAHAHDADCALFLKARSTGSAACASPPPRPDARAPLPPDYQVFAGDVDEGVRAEQAAMLAEVLRVLTLLDVSINYTVGAAGRVAGGMLPHS